MVGARGFVGFTVLVASLVGCSNEPSMAEALQKAAAEDQAKKAAEQAAVAARPAPTKDPAALELPWSFTQVRDTFVIGTKLAYAMTGTNAKGKKVDDAFLAEVKGADDKEVRFVAYRRSQESNAAVKQIQSLRWTTWSPLFSVEQAEHTLLRRETIEVPAGSFDTVVVELKGFFGQHFTVWMVQDRPGVYAKVIEHANAAEEGDKTEIEYALTELHIPS